MSILGSFFMFITWLGQAGLLFDRSIEWSEYGFRFSAVKAAHSDPYAIGVIIENLARKQNILYNRRHTLQQRDLQ